MKTKVWFKNLENGQVIPIVVVSLFALIAMAALMIDGGMLLSHRRTAQAAADAGALAGAKSLCPTEDYSKANAIDSAQEYVEKNKAEWIELSHESQFPNSNTIRVETSVSSQAFFAPIFDIFGLTAVAAAEANCTPAITAQVLPLAFPCYPGDFYKEEGQEELPPYVEYVSDSENCYLKFGDLEKTDEQNFNDGVMVLILTGNTYDEWCMDSGGPINCDDPKRQSVLAGESHNGWLSLEGNTGTSSLRSLIIDLDGWASRGEWIYGEGGAMDTLFNPPLYPLPSLEDRVVTVPLFNEFCRGDPSIHCSPPNMDPGKMRPGDTVTCKNNNCGSQGVGDLFYRIDAFAALKITCVRKGNQTCDYQQHLIEAGTVTDKNSFWNSTNSIEGYFVKSDIPYGGGGGLDTGVMVVQLTK